MYAVFAVRSPSFSSVKTAEELMLLMEATAPMDPMWPIAEEACERVLRHFPHVAVYTLRDPDSNFTFHRRIEPTYCATSMTHAFYVHVPLYLVGVPHDPDHDFVAIPGMPGEIVDRPSGLRSVRYRARPTQTALK